MVGLFGFLAAYFQTPALLVVGPVFYGFSHLVFSLRDVFCRTGLPSICRHHA